MRFGYFNLPLLTWLLATALLSQDTPPNTKRLQLIHRLAGTVTAVMPLQSRGGGSGVIIDKEGTVLTNFHVVARSLNSRLGDDLGVMKCGTRDGRLRLAKIIGLDPGGDLALLRLLPNKDEPVANFPYSPLGTTADLRVGDFVLAMGNPFLLATDFTPTVTMGIVSGVHRYLPGQRGKLVYPDCVQTDASVNPGNSGGPLFDMKGHIVGINGRISVGQRGRVNVGMGFAIGADQIRFFLPDLRAGRLCYHGSLQLDAREYQGNLVVASIQENGPAWNAGIRISDILIKLDDKPIVSQNDLLQRIARLPSGWTVRLTWRTPGADQLRKRTICLVPATVPDKKLQNWEPSSLDNILALEKKRYADLAHKALKMTNHPGPGVTRTFSNPKMAATLAPPTEILPALGKLRPPFSRDAEFDGGTRIMGRAAVVILLPGEMNMRLFLDPDSGLPLASGWSPDLDQSEIRLVVTNWQESPAGRWPQRISWRRDGKEILTETIQLKTNRRSL